MKWMNVCIAVLMVCVPAVCADGRHFKGKIDTASPASASIGIEKVYAMFSKTQLDEMRKDPTVIMEYRLASWIEGNWLANENDRLCVWFKNHGIELKSSMSLFIVRGFQFKLYGKKFIIKNELKSPGWQLRPPPPPPPPSISPSSDH